MHDELRGHHLDEWMTLVLGRRVYRALTENRQSDAFIGRQLLVM